MQVKDRALQGLGEHVSMILLGVLVFHSDFPFSHPFENFQVPYIGTNRYQMLGYGQQPPRAPFAPSRLASRKRGEQACGEP